MDKIKNFFLKQPINPMVSKDFIITPTQSCWAKPLTVISLFLHLQHKHEYFTFIELVFHLEKCPQFESKCPNVVLCVSAGVFLFSIWFCGPAVFPSIICCLSEQMSDSEVGFHTYPAGGSCILDYYRHIAVESKRWHLWFLYKLSN